MHKIIIVGGGSAGWMTAATLIKTFPKKNITVIDSPSVPTVGVGESTLQAMKAWTTYLEIDDKDFLKHTDGTYKLGIKFTDLYKKGETFHYPFGQPFIVNNKAELNDWWFKKFLKPETSNYNYAECYYPQMAYINQNKLSKSDNIPFDFEHSVTYHFDATKFGLWLRDHYCIPRGVKHIKEHIKTIEQNKDGVASLNGKHKADLYIDCTGFRSILLGKTLKEEFINYNDRLPNNSAWATRIKYKNKEKQLVPYTDCTAIENGWVWRVPLWSRLGTGYVYSDKFVSDQDALKEFKSHLKNREKVSNVEKLEYRNIKSRVGIHRRLWVKNVVAIGLSAGFIEPLEGNGLFSVHEFLMKLVRTLNRGKVSQWDKDNFTFQCKLLFDNFSQFVAMHYALSQRTDTKYWKENFNKEWSRHLIDLKRDLTEGFVTNAITKNSLFQFEKSEGLHCIAAGMNWPPTDLESMLYLNKINKKEWIRAFKPCIDNLNKQKKLWDKSVKSSPSFYSFMKEHIYCE